MHLRLLTKYPLRTVSVVLILCVAAALRLYQLGAVPAGMTWDEAAIGYNGYAILHTRRDEWLEKLPVSFKSFGDYKAPLAIYLNGPFTAVFGMEVWAVRLPFALAGIAAIAFCMLFVSELFHKHQHRFWYTVAAGILLTLSPWHLHFSRIGFESGIALSLLFAGLYFFFAHQSLQQRSWRHWVLPVLSALSFTLSLYAYHSAKLVVPLLALFLLVYFRKHLASTWKAWALAGGTAALLCIPLLRDAVAGGGLTRADVTVFSGDTPSLQVASTILSNILTHLSPHFLLFGETTTLRHGSGVWGVLLPTTFSLILFAVGNTLWRVWRARTRATFVFLFGVVLVGVGILPAAITQEVPHANRALLSLPGFLLLALSGVDALQEVLSRFSNSAPRGSKGEQHLAQKAVLGTMLCIHLLLATALVQHYFTDFAAASTHDFYEGYIPAFTRAVEYEKGLNGTPEVERILFTSQYGQPYIYALFVRKTNPIWYQGGSLVKYQFVDSITEGDLDRRSTLLVATPADDLSAEPDEVIYGSDGSVRFQLYYRKE